jgi:8-oxo-dGTP pyrophosphatase MutT (NUDIX family)
MRRPEEVLVVVYRRHRHGPEFLVLERSAERHGYWHVVAGALEPDEEATAAAARELREETGLDAPVEDLGLRFLYSLDDEPPDVRARFAADVTEIVVRGFAAEARPSWEPLLDEEHVGYRWCAADEAVALLRYPEPQDAVRATARRLEVKA